MKILWTGSDSLFLNKFPPGIGWKMKIYIRLLRIFSKIAEIFIQEHYAVSANVENNLVKFGLKKRIIKFPDPPLYKERFEKKEHEGFNVLYYFPKGGSKYERFKRWLYGYEFYAFLSKVLPVNFIIVDGSQDMSEIYPIVDFYLRPNRHDGNPRMIMECEINGIPYYWNHIGEPSLGEMRTKIEKEYERKTGKKVA